MFNVKCQLVITVNVRKGNYDAVPWAGHFIITRRMGDNI